MIPLGYVHNLYHFLDRNGLVCINRERRILLLLEKTYKCVLDLVKLDGSLFPVDVVCDRICVVPVLDRYAYRSFG